MADTYTGKTITEFTESASGDDTDLILVGNRGTSILRKLTLANLAAYAKSKTAELSRTGTIGSVAIDFNSISDGWHQVDASAAITNGPVVGRQTGILYQTSNTAGNGTKYQMYSSTNGAECWQRVCWYGTWGAWKLIGGKLNMSVTVGNGSVMTLSNNTSTQTGDYMYVNCGIRFTGARASGTLLLRLPNTVSATQYLTVYKTTGTFYMTNIAAGTGDIACPAAFASGDIVIITGVVRY